MAILREEEPPTSERDKLELIKLQLEINELGRPFWKRPSYVLGALPTLLAIITLAYGLTSGYFSASFTKLENQKHDLEKQIKDFDATRLAIQKQIAELQSQKQE
jgi:cell division protein FtsB